MGHPPFLCPLRFQIVPGANAAYPACTQMPTPNAHNFPRTAVIEEHNRNPKPFIWTAKANDILEKVKRARANLNNSPSV
jgi:hypothetical protein